MFTRAWNPNLAFLKFADDLAKQNKEADAARNKRFQGDTMEQMKWQPIETAPKDGQWIDAFSAENGKRAITRWAEFSPVTNPGFFGWDGWGPRNEPTHWLPMPSLPSA